jgi:indole-3-glycerol phosphate synthase
VSNILEIIVAAKKKEVEEKKKLFNRQWVQTHAKEFDRRCISLKENLLTEGSTGIIAEFKRRSPSKGWFKPAGYPAPDIVGQYENFGAAGASILTDKEFFGGDNNDLTLVRAVSSLPLLRKDFIIDEVQVREAKAIGADIILLIAAILTAARVKELAGEAKGMGMEVLLELHEEAGLGHICDDTEIIGINNRNLKTFEVDMDRSLRMAEQVPAGKIKIAESDIGSAEDILKFRQQGYQGFLIGEKFMKEENPGLAFELFVSGLKPMAK